MNPGDQAADDALRRGLRTKALSAEALQRIRRATEAEWRQQVETPVAIRRRWPKFAAAASVMLLAGIGTFRIHQQDQRALTGAPLGVVARSEAPGLNLAQRLRADIALGEGASLRVTASLEARGDALVALSGGGNLRVARGSEFEVTSADTVRLRRGELYVDIAPGTRNQAAFRIATPAGEFRHVGTQFAVAIVGDQTRLRVREGAVEWTGGQDGARIEAGTELLVDASREITRRPIGITGRDWAWAEALAPEIDIENRPLHEFLEWFSRETGRKLVLADAGARTQAAQIRMHGNVRGLTALEALTAVMAATTLHYELPEGVIRVSSARATGSPN